MTSDNPFEKPDEKKNSGAIDHDQLENSGKSRRQRSYLGREV
jgi:hypothetical protein